jgi:hypothetical protein
MRGVRLGTTAPQGIEVLPRFKASEPMAYGLMFYDYERALDADWLSVLERLFGRFQEAPAVVVSSLGSKRAKGRYNRVKLTLPSL